MTDNAMAYLSGVVAHGFERDVHVPHEGMNHYEHGYMMASTNHLGDFWLDGDKQTRLDRVV